MLINDCFIVVLPPKHVGIIRRRLLLLRLQHCALTSLSSSALNIVDSDNVDSQDRVYNKQQNDVSTLTYHTVQTNKTTALQRLLLCCQTNIVFLVTSSTSTSTVYRQRQQQQQQLQLDAAVSKQEKLCIGNTVNKCGAGRRHNNLYIHSPGGAFSVISFRRAVIL